ncbi:MAG: DUF6152 family protein [Gammaproteobacteria bacterium]
MRIFRRSLALAGAIALVTAVADGHHAYDANYGQDNGSIEGVVVEVFWGNPHVHYYLEVTSDDGTTMLWDVESENLGVMAREGWTSETLQLGDHVRVSGRLGREGRPRLALDLESLERLD